MVIADPNPADCEVDAATCRNCGRGIAHDEACGSRVPRLLRPLTADESHALCRRRLAATAPRTQAVDRCKPGRADDAMARDRRRADRGPNPNAEETIP